MPKVLVNDVLLKKVVLMKSINSKYTKSFSSTFTSISPALMVGCKTVKHCPLLLSYHPTPPCLELPKHHCCQSTIAILMATSSPSSSTSSLSLHQNYTQSMLIQNLSVSTNDRDSVMEGNMNSGYEGSLPEALGKRIVVIVFFIAIVIFFIVAIYFFIVVTVLLARAKDKWKEDKERSWFGGRSRWLERPCHVLARKSPKGSFLIFP